MHKIIITTTSKSKNESNLFFPWADFLGLQISAPAGR